MSQFSVSLWLPMFFAINALVLVILMIYIAKIRKLHRNALKQLLLENEQHQFEKTESEQLLQKIYMSSPYGMLITNDKGIIESVNEQVEIIFGFNSNEMIGKSVEMLLPERFRANHEIYRQQYHHSQQKKLMGLGRNLFGLKKTGDEFSIEVGLSTVSQYDALKIIVTMTDISQINRMQQKLMEEHERAVVTLSSIGDGVITTNTDAIVESMNSIAEKLTGWSSDEAIGKHISEVYRVINDKTGQQFDNSVLQCLKKQSIVQHYSDTSLVHNSLLPKKVMHIPIHENVAPIHSDQGVLIGTVLVFQDVTQLREYAREIEYQAHHDALTGLLNRRMFENRLSSLLVKVNEKKADHVLLYLDLDRFKMINDTAGHAAGDELLKKWSNIILKKLRQRDTFARLGGDEFGIILEHCSRDRGLKIANILCNVVEDFKFYWDGRVFSIGVSIGMIPFNSSQDNSEKLLSKADAACSNAKQNGRNRVQLYDGNAEKKLGETQIVNMLTHAFENNLMRLYQQRIKAIDGVNNCDHFEILVRMLDDEGKVIPPGVFLPAAERYGLATSLDRWVIRTAFKWLNEHKADFIHLPALSINLSAQSITDEIFVDFIKDQFRIHQIEPTQICFEITETSAMYNLALAIEFIKDLKSLGCQFALDDFGSGHAAYAQLKYLPMDYLKIDGSLVKDILEDSIDFSIVKSVNEVGHVLGIKTIAEYVENKEIMQKLMTINVDYFQGYEISKPLPIDQLLVNKPCRELSMSS